MLAILHRHDHRSLQYPPSYADLFTTPHALLRDSKQGSRVPFVSSSPRVSRRHVAPFNPLTAGSGRRGRNLGQLKTINPGIEAG
jgi:hypothetical protein